MTPPRIFSALPPVGCREASPKAISGRTSYLRVRLEFLPYPPLLAALFNGRAFGPPMPFTAPSSWRRVDHPVSGLRRPTPNAPLRLGFPSAPHLRCLTLPDGATRRTVLQKVRRRTHAVLRQFVNAGFQVLFHSPPGVLFTFPSRYCALSVTSQCLALRGGPRAFPQGFSCLAVLWIPRRRLSLRLRGFHPLRRDFPDPSAGIGGRLTRSEPRGARAPVWAPSVSLAATPEIILYFLFLRLLRCFSSPGSLPEVMDWLRDD